MNRIEKKMTVLLGKRDLARSIAIVIIVDVPLTNLFANDNKEISLLLCIFLFFPTQFTHDHQGWSSGMSWREKGGGREGELDVRKAAIWQFLANDERRREIGVKSALRPLRQQLISYLPSLAVPLRRLSDDDPSFHAYITTPRPS